VGPAPPLLSPISSETNAERSFKKAILRLVKGGPERLAIEAGQIDAIIDPTSGNAILLPDAQRALIERKVGFRSLIGLAFDWYWEQDERYCFVSHRGATDDAFGFAEEGIIGKALWDLSIENLSEADWQTHRQQLEWRVAFRELEIRRVDRDGEMRHLSISGEPIFDDRDQFKGYRGITRDITARKRSEAAAQESNRFARTVLDKTAVCNRHHSLDQQLCRWLLLSLDRLQGDELVMTQELIANMLGVRREGVTEGAVKLQHAGLIRYARGRITVLDRPGLEKRTCECYAVVKKEYDRLLPEVLGQ
jgi:PAS domain S-box-containing protein